MKHTVSGRITRLVPEDGVNAARVFFTPNDSNVFRSIDGSLHVGREELAVPVPGGDLSKFAVGDAFTADIGK